MHRVPLLSAHSFDWSGSGKNNDRQPGIVLASGASGRAPSVKRGWTRVAVLDEALRLARLATQGGRILLGFDFAFSFPWAEKGGAFPDGSTSRAAFWRTVHSTCWPEGVARTYVEAHRAHFLWYDARRRITVRGATYVHALRRTDRAAAARRATPNTVFKLVGANQVGKGSLTGIALLQELALRCAIERTNVAVWPFFVIAAGEVLDVHSARSEPAIPENCLVVVETYPSLQWADAGLDGRPWRDARSVATLADAFGVELPSAAFSRGDEADAFAAWCALAGRGPHSNVAGCDYLARWSPAAEDADAASSEGWIFGL